jgi:hypothetical protein
MCTNVNDAVLCCLMLVFSVRLICFAFTEEKRVRSKLQKKMLIEKAQKSIDWSSADVCPVALNAFQRNMLLDDDSICK